MAAEQDGGGRLMSDRVFGIVGVALLAMALLFGVRSCGEGGSDTGVRPGADGVPTLVLLSPAAGTEVDQPAAVEFDTGAPLVLGPTGWTAGGRHLHLMVNRTELMAGATDVRALGGTRYRWTLPRQPAGPVRLHLAWSDESHQTMDAGASRPVDVRLR